jgi:glycosyltransferase involved in cell wall biosynthesis
MKKRPKVLYAVTVPESIKLMRGQHDYLRKEGYDVHLIYSPVDELSQISIDEGVVSHPIAMEREISLLRDALSLFRLIKVFLSVRPDISNVGTPKAGLLAGIAALFTRVPRRIYTLRGLRLETTKGIKRRILICAEKVACRCAHQVICVSNSLRDKVVELGIVDYKKTLVLGMGSSNGIDNSKFQLTDEIKTNVNEIRRKLKLTKNCVVIGFVGRLTRDKGIVELIEAYKIVKKDISEVKMLLVGNFEEGDMIPQGTIDFIHNDPNIILSGYIDNVVPYYYCMNVLAFPTYREGFSNVSLEASAAGIPVVTTDATGSIDTVIHNKTGYIVPVGNVECLANSLLDLLLNKEKAMEFGLAGKKRAEEEFKPETIWRNLNKIYRESL